MFGFPRLRERMSAHRGGANLLDRILGDLAAFTGADWEQEDDVTIVTLASATAPDAAARAAGDARRPAAAAVTPKRLPRPSSDDDEPTSRQIVRFSLPSEPGGERAPASGWPRWCGTRGSPTTRPSG